ncbi:MAG TPA: hypothetical protein VFA81_02655 [Burkholderiales bacterium]|nr:hypothetical protein [Burkholderiales bacterium]
MPWIKLGRIHCLEASPTRATLHMQVPTPLLTDSTIRIYFAARNALGKSYPAYLDVRRDNPLAVLRVDDTPVMAHGPIGTFDEDGAMPGCALRLGPRIHLYYSGWNQRKSIPYHNTTGLAISRDGGEFFCRMFDGPILDRTSFEPYMAVTPWVVKEEALWRMWYVSGLSWTLVDERYEPVYGIKYAESTDGVQWKRPGVLVIPRKHDREACAHPSVILQAGVYHMWFCYRDTVDFRDGKGSYRIGYASSPDGFTWKRQDHLSGIDVSRDGWDSTMLCYPSVLECDGRLLLFYNGNSFGQSGIGCAVWEGPLP